MNNGRGFAISAFVAILFASPVASSQFLPLGGIQSNGSWLSFATALSADGATVVGTTFLSPTAAAIGEHSEAFRWTEDTAMVLLRSQFSSDVRDTFPAAVSANGHAIAGTLFGVGYNRQAFRWTIADGILGIGSLPPQEAGVNESEAQAISPDGNAIYGYSNQPFRWTPTDGLQPYPNIVTAVSADSTTSTGDYFNPSSQTSQPYVLSQGTGFLPLGNLITSNESGHARAISADGHTVVGNIDSFGFRWTAAGGMLNLGFLPASDMTVVSAVSSDGEFVFGTSYLPSTSTAFIWDPEHSMRQLQDVLSNEYGLKAALSGWNLFSVAGVSIDGHVLAGSGVNPQGKTEAWLVRLDQPLAVPEPGTLVAGIAATVFVIAFYNRPRV